MSGSTSPPLRGRVITTLSRVDWLSFATSRRSRTAGDIERRGFGGYLIPTAEARQNCRSRRDPALGAGSVGNRDAMPPRRLRGVAERRVGGNPLARLIGRRNDGRRARDPL